MNEEDNNAEMLIIKNFCGFNISNAPLQVSPEQQLDEKP